jgi:hypothetical protein
MGRRVTVTNPDGETLVTHVRGIDVHRPADRPDSIAFLHGSEGDDFVVIGAVIRG